MGQHPVSDDFHIPPYTGNGIHQRQPVQRSGWVVGNNDQRAMFRDLFEIAGGNGAEYIEVLQNLLHHIQAFQMAVCRGKLLEFFFVEQSF